MNSLPFRFNPRRHQRLLRLTRIRGILLTVYIVCLSFMTSTVVFTAFSPENWEWAVVGLVLAVISGVAFRASAIAVKKEHR